MPARLLTLVINGNSERVLWAPAAQVFRTARGLPAYS